MQPLWEQLKQQGNILYAEERYSEAIADYTRAIQHNNEQAVLFTNRALAYLKLQRYDSAQQDAEKAISLSSSSIKAHYVLGRCFAEGQELAAAVKSFKRCMEMANVVDTKVSLHREMFKHYFTTRKRFYGEERQKKLANLESKLDECKRTLHDDAHTAVVEQLLIMAAETHCIGDEHKAVLSTTDDRSIPECFLCPITYEVMSDPVMVVGAANPQRMCSKSSYERSAIEKHFATNGPIDPIGRFRYEPQPCLLTNTTLKSAIVDFLEAHPWLYED